MGRWSPKRRSPYFSSHGAIGVADLGGFYDDRFTIRGLVHGMRQGSEEVLVVALVRIMLEVVSVERATKPKQSEVTIFQDDFVRACETFIT